MPREKRKEKQKNAGSILRKMMSNIPRKRLSSGKNLVQEMLSNQETLVHLILIEKSEAASTVVLLSSALKKKVSRRKWAVEKEKKVCEKDRG